MNTTETTHILHQLGEESLPYGAISPPIVQSSLFTFESFDRLREALDDEYGNLIYTRGNNPTVALCEQKLAALEHGQRAKLFGSGTAAIAAAIMACLKGGEHIVAVSDCYGWSRFIMGTYLKRFGIRCTFTSSDTASIQKAIEKDTCLIYLESPTSMTFRLQDLEGVARLAKEHGCKTIIDNTWATPLYQNPIDLGIDIVVHSASKYLGGSSDIIAGVVIGSEEFISHLFDTEFMAMGQVPDPFMAWLLLRGLRTLHIRLPQHQRNALKLIDFLKDRSEVASVTYPLDSSHPDFELACSQLRGGCGLFSFELATESVEDVRRFCDALKVFKRAVSWGGYESLVFPAAAGYRSDELVPADKRSVIRLHAGLEDIDLLKEDLKKGFAAL